MTYWVRYKYSLVAHNFQCGMAYYLGCYLILDRSFVGKKSIE